MYFLRKAKAKQTQNTQTVIAEIHNEFDTAAERLLNEAKEIIGKTDKVKIDRAQRLKRLGFYQSKTVSESMKQLEDENKSKELAGAIMYYQLHYPNYKFITDQEVTTICKKYKLVCGEVGYYKGDVPEKNLKEIENFKLRDEDKAVEVVYRQGSPSFDNSPNSNDWEWNWLQRLALARPQIIAGETGRKTIPKLKICAPQSDFDMTRMIVSEDYRLVSMPIPDPIVLQPVKHGHLILSKWGLEANDEMVINEKMN